MVTYISPSINEECFEGDASGVATPTLGMPE